MAELHTLSCPPLLDLLIAELLANGARAARSGEFTLRAFLAGKLDLTRAEAVHDVIAAGGRDALKQALSTLAGGVSGPLKELRTTLLDLLADLEAGLDFSDEDISFVTPESLLQRLGHALAVLAHLERQLVGRTLTDRPFRVVLTGAPNVGKSSLFNALTGGEALVSPEPGTTRDYLIGRLAVDGIIIELIDTAGLRDTHDAIEEQSQSFARSQTEEADLILRCEVAGAESRQFGEGIVIWTKCDLSPPPTGSLATSVVTGKGLGALRILLAEKARNREQSAPLPSVSRCRHHVTACTERLRHAHQMVLFGDPPELIALELRGALDELGELVGTVYTDDLLDRIFSRFCIGK